MSEGISVFRIGNDKRPPGGGGGQNAVISDQVKLRWRHEGGKFFDHLAGLQNDVTGAIAPGALEAIQQPAVGQKRKPLCPHRRAARVTAEPF